MLNIHFLTFWKIFKFPSVVKVPNLPSSIISVTKRGLPICLNYLKDIFRAIRKNTYLCCDKILYLLSRYFKFFELLKHLLHISPSLLRQVFVLKNISMSLGHTVTVYLSVYLGKIFHISWVFIWMYSYRLTKNCFFVFVKFPPFW